MLKSRNNASPLIASLSLGKIDVASMLQHEWLLSNSRGSYCCSSVIGCNTRRYHSLLAASLEPPANRVAALSNCLETITVAGRQIQLSTFEFEGLLSPRGYRYLTAFRKDTAVHFDYDIGPVALTRSVYLAPDNDVVAIIYDFTSVYQPFDFSVRPFAALRDFHSLQNRLAPIYSFWKGDGLVVRTSSKQTGQLFLKSGCMWFEQEAQWWERFFYRIEQQRGQDCYEDLYSPGVFNARVEAAGRLVIWAGFGPCTSEDEYPELDFDLGTVIDSLALREKEITAVAKSSDPELYALCSAAGQFVIERSYQGEPAATILAGFPWFLDWGRDAFISLPGLLLCTGRFDAASSVLQTFARTIDQGMIPNRFDDYADQTHYNSVDASLWFVHAAFEYLRASGDSETFSVKLLPVIRWILDAYRRGTMFGIHADSDGLITAGSPDTQLTWMDAKYNGRVFTPRHGKAVEVNALWYNALARLAEYYSGKNPDQHSFYSEQAQKVKDSFVAAFWNEEKGYLNDCISPDGIADSALRPNQLFAVSLPFSPLAENMQKSIVKTCRKHLLTPFGLRTLAPFEPGYTPIYIGPQSQRDAAYHNGPAWPFLIGTFVEAFLKVNDFSPKSKTQALAFLRPLLEHLTGGACIGSISELFDAEPPYAPGGCFAQAWSVAETLRAYSLIKS